MSEERLKNWIISHFKRKHKEMIVGDYNNFIEYLKEEHLVTDGICSSGVGKSILKKILNAYELKDINPDELYEHIKLNATFVLTQDSGWEIKEISLLSETPNIENIKCYFAEFIWLNKWGYELSKYKHIYKIMYYANKVIWIGYAGDYFEPHYFIIQKNKIYGLKYKHKCTRSKSLKIMKNLDNAFDELLHVGLDDIAQQYREKKFNIIKTEIDLSEYFYKGFFYKGILFDRNWKDEISVIKKISFNNGLLKIEIENLTYPHTGYALLDLENSKVVEVDKPMVL
ncbi:MAG: hypothetical protein FWE72_00735 [Spirochaetaceae bacterium]|nr:hypothetical protein [Spirochaetaceae bacterium]